MASVPKAGKSRHLDKAELRQEVDRLKHRCSELEAEHREQLHNTARYLELAEIILVALDHQGMVTMIGGKAHELLGYKQGELIGKNWLKVCLPEEDYDRLHAVHQQLIKDDSDQVEYFENKVVCKDGQHRWIAWHNSVTRDRNGKVIGTLSSGIDITQRRRANKAMKESEEKYRLLFENMTTGFALHEIICDDDGKPNNYRYLEVNPAFEKLTGVSPSQLVGNTILDILPDTEQYWIDVSGRVALTGEPVSYQNYSRELGKYYDTWLFSPRKNQFAVIFSDITERKQQENELNEAVERLALATRAAQMGVWDWDITNDELHWDDRMFEIFGTRREEFTGGYDAWLECVHVDDRERADKSIKDAIEHGKPCDIDFRVMWPDGSIHYIKADGQVSRDEEGRPVRMTGVNYDITERIHAQQKLQFMAHHDDLTSLPNRVLFMDRLSHALPRAGRSNKSVALLFLDLDRFKYINDTFGHETGDEFLIMIAERLGKEIRGSDTVARLGGDEFAIILEETDSIDDVIVVCEKILEVLAEPFMIKSHQFYATTSIGISMYPEDAGDSQTLLKHSDTAMYRAKELGRNNFQFYSKDLSDMALDRLNLEIDIRRALEQEEFELYYQPQIDLNTRVIVALEVLLRWNHPKLGVVTPSKFISVAEETGLVIAIGNWVLRNACKQLHEWKKQGLAVVPLSVNLSGRQFVDRSLVDFITKTFNENKVDPGLLELEITEGVMIHNPESASSSLVQLNDMGVRIAIDDFGTGYSSLSYLKRYPIDTIKIDKSFVRDLTSDSSDMSIVMAIIAMAHSMGLRVVAEGVETSEQLDFLESNECDIGQGYLFSHPLQQEAITSYLMKNITTH